MSVRRLHRARSWPLPHPDPISACRVCSGDVQGPHALNTSCTDKQTFYFDRVTAVNWKLVQRLTGNRRRPVVSRRLLFDSFSSAVVFLAPRSDSSNGI